MERITSVTSTWHQLTWQGKTVPNEEAWKNKYKRKVR
jgi:hypothetical protein